TLAVCNTVTSASASGSTVKHQNDVDDQRPFSTSDDTAGVRHSDAQSVASAAAAASASAKEKECPSKK
ncbi:unnamed protein product, partial [Caenorhabditis auriculariae]